MFRSRLDAAAAFAVPLALGLTLVATPAPDGARASEAPPTTSFSEEIAPILEKYCLSCHGGVGEDGQRVVEVSLDLTTWDGVMAGSEYGSVVEPGDPAKSILVEMIEDGTMPEEGDPVPPADLEKIRSWIAEGALNN